MPGSGKSETSAYLASIGLSLVRFGDLTEEGLAEQGLPVTPENEQKFREEIRQKHGMEAYAVLAEPKINELLSQNKSVVIDGLYSWEEYKFLTTRLKNLKLIHIYAEPSIRYERLSKRSVRPFTIEEAKSRDISEIEKLNKGGPIAIADYVAENNSDVDSLKQRLSEILERNKKS